VSKAYKVIPVFRGLRVFRVQPECKELRASKEFKVLQVYRVKPVFLGQQVLPVLPVFRV
jgi:hypothetical protein